VKPLTLRHATPPLPSASHKRLSIPMRLAVLSTVFLLAACASEMRRREGIDLVIDGHYEEGLAKLEQATQADPKNIMARRDLIRQREQVLNRILAAAGSEMAQSHFDAAEKQYRRAIAIEPNNQAANVGLTNIESEKRHAKWLAEAEVQQAKGDIAGAKATIDIILVENPGDTKANQLRYALAEQTLKHNIAGPTLNITSRKPVTLQFRDANLRMVLEAIARTTSINILVDKDVRNDIKVTLFVKDTPVEETLDLILLQNQLEKRVLGENTVLIYPFNASKSKDYQELKVRRFALTNADPKQVQSMLKTILKTKDIFVDEKTNAVIIRDTPESIRLAEKMVTSMDQPEAEVMIELELLDVDRTRSLALGVNWPSSVSYLLPTTQTLSQLKQMGPSNVTVTIPNFGLAVQALESDSDTRVLANPRIRARNKEKAKIMIGNRTPVISSAAVPNTVSASTVYNTNIQYLDTGIKLEVEPTIYLDGDVAIKLNMEVSDLGAKFQNDATGTLAYATTTNNATTILRLKDGETQILAGLVRTNITGGASQKVPGLGDIPVIGRLFGVNSDSSDNREIVLAVTPHIIRNNQISEADLLEMWSGTEANVKYGEPNLQATGSAGVFGQSATGAATSRIQPAYNRPVIPQPAASTPAISPDAAAESTASLAANSLVTTLTGPQQAKIGDKFTVVVNSQGSASVKTIAFELQYDTETLKAVAINEGDLMRRAHLRSTFDPQINEGSGTISANLAAETGGTAGGAGSIASVQFEVIAAPSNTTGPASISVTSISATSKGGAAVSMSTPPPLSVTVQPSQ
jgi:general secretion pathway protein D